MAEIRDLRLDPQTLITLGIIIGLLVVGYVAGHYKGVESVQDQIVTQGGQVSLNGTVKSVSDDGLKVEVGKDTWTVKYATKTSGTGGAGGTGGPAGSTGGTGGSTDSEIKKGDEVQISGTPIGEHTVVTQSVSKVVKPTPSPQSSGSPSAAAPAGRP